MEFWKLNYELEFWKLNLKEIGILKIKLWKLESWKLFEDGILKINKIIIIIIIIINKCENWNFGNWKLNSEIGILKNYLKIEVLKIKFENRNFEKLFENRILAIIWK